MKSKTQKEDSQKWYKAVPTLNEAKFTGFILERAKGPECMFLSFNSELYISMICNLYITMFKQTYEKYERYLNKSRYVKELRNGIVSDEFINSSIWDEILFRTIPNKMSDIAGDKFRKAICESGCKVNRALIRELSVAIRNDSIYVNVTPQQTKHKIVNFELLIKEIEDAWYGLDEQELTVFKKLEKGRILFCSIIEGTIPSGKSKKAVSRLARLFMVSQTARQIGSVLPYYDMKDVFPQYKERLAAYKDREKARADETRKAAIDFIISKGINNITDISACHGHMKGLHHEVMSILSQFINEEDIKSLENSNKEMYNEVRRYIGMGRTMGAFYGGRMRIWPLC